MRSMYLGARLARVLDPVFRCARTTFTSLLYLLCVSLYSSSIYAMRILSGKISDS